MEMDGEIQAKFENVDAEFRRVNHRIEDLEQDRKEMRDLVGSVKELALSAKYTNEKMDKMSEQMNGMDSRLENIEKKPLGVLESVKSSAVGVIVSFIVGILLTAAVWAIKNGGGI